MMQYKFFPEVKAFSSEDFKSPSESFYPMYVWQWQSDVSHEETDRQLAEMQRLGIKAVYVLPLPIGFRPTTMGTTLTPDYLTPPYFEEYHYMVERAASMGMTLWIYDEGGWPSGGAGGKIMLEHPEYARRTLAKRTVTEADGTEKTEYYSKKLLFEKPGMSELPDCIREDAVAEFIKVTHEAYKPYLQEHFGKAMTSVFTDEPTVARPVPYSQELAAEFEKRYGYSIEPYLWVLLDDAGARELAYADPEAEAIKARMDWFDMCSDLLCNNFLLKNKKWTNDNHMSFAGHMDGDDKPLGYGCYYVMRALRCFDVPGVDVIWRQIFPANEPKEWNSLTGVTCENKFFPRYASSAAAQIGTGRALTESFGVYGEGLTFEQMRYVLQFQAVRGINVFNLFGIPYGRRGRLRTGELPFFTEKHACYGDLPVFNAFMERLAYVASIGYSNNRTALYIPMQDLWAGLTESGDRFEALAAQLERLQIPFDILDDDVLKAPDRLEKASAQAGSVFLGADRKALAEGRICVGKACYDTVVIPPCIYMPKESREALEIFAKGGGRVLMCGNVNEDAASVQTADNSVYVEISGAETVTHLAEALKSPLIMEGDIEYLRLGDRVADNGRLFMIFNEGAEKAAFTVQTDEACVLLNPLEGQIVMPKREGNKLALVLESGDMVCLWFEKVPAEALTEGSANIYAYQQTHDAGCKEQLLDGPYTMRRTKQFIIGEMDFVLDEIVEEAAPVALGDWSDIVGRAFSGSCVYTTHFAKPEAAYVELDLGEVRYTCEVFVNGKSMGVQVMPPYRFILSAADLQEDNILEIRVTNTAANEYQYTKSFDKWKPWQLGPYWNKEKAFQEDSLTGGLVGPVKIRY